MWEKSNAFLKNCKTWLAIYVWHTQRERKRESEGESERERKRVAATQLYYNVAAANLHSWGKVYPDFSWCFFFFLRESKANLIPNLECDRDPREATWAARAHSSQTRKREKECVRELCRHPKVPAHLSILLQANHRIVLLARPSHNVAPLQFNSHRGGGYCRTWHSHFPSVFAICPGAIAWLNGSSWSPPSSWLHSVFGHVRRHNESYC